MNAQQEEFVKRSILEISQIINHYWKLWVKTPTGHTIKCLIQAKILVINLLSAIRDREHLASLLRKGCDLKIILQGIRARSRSNSHERAIQDRQRLESLVTIVLSQLSEINKDFILFGLFCSFLCYFQSSQPNFLLFTCSERTATFSWRTRT